MIIRKSFSSFFAYPNLITSQLEDILNIITLSVWLNLDSYLFFKSFTILFTILGLLSISKTEYWQLFYTFSLHKISIVLLYIQENIILVFQDCFHQKLYVFWVFLYFRHQRWLYTSKSSALHCPRLSAFLIS